MPKRWDPLPLNDQISVGALAASNAAKTNYGLTQDYQMDTWIFHSIHWDGNNNPGGRLLFGICQGDLTVTEIAEALSAQPLYRGEIPAQEHASRYVRVAGGLQPYNDDDNAMFAPVAVQTRMTFSEDQDFAIFVYNVDNGTLTTGDTVRYHGLGLGRFLS